MNIGLHHYNTSSSTSTHDHDYDYDIMWSSNNGDRNSELRVVEIDLPSIIINNNTNSSFVEQQPTKPKSTTRKSKSNTKILGFADMNYKDIAFKWYQELTELGYTEHIVVAYDVPTEQYFQHNNMRYDTIHDHTNPDDDQQLFQNNHTFPTSITIDQCKNTYDNRWKREAQQNQIYKRRLFGSRWNYVLRQLQLGYNVLLTDVDNVFVRYIDLYDEFENNNSNNNALYDSYHAYAGTVNAFPRNIYKEVGFTICGGMTFLRASSKGVLEIVKALVERCGCQTTLYCHCSCDDQVVLNGMLLMDPSPYKIQWDNPTNNTIIPTKEDDINWEEMTGTVTTTVGSHRVKIWNRHVAFRRHYESDPKLRICPNKERSWIAMPSGIDRMKVRDIWMNGCRG
eukprot:CAMPEP_0170909076 /NCGR_PEP_ID=MMETSP0735-20130129/2299_1 /TAXON_ID=186038 /ORGANISM="Fragilariopsis kerguelensis, Strain L26-C5" /LENGTH=395 /DNA_ID=CAMNT_0011305549 /DNA_START=189 /DNA_END=1376 /DNA_ORIENTATION=-